MNVLVCYSVADSGISERGWGATMEGGSKERDAADPFLSECLLK